MAAERLETALRHIRQLVAPRSADGWPDAQLLERFIAEQDAEAFTALVRRHGRLVWDVCRRVLGHEQDAEDAFQVTFLVLTQKAASVRRKAALGSWLHGAAYRSALEIKRKAARRRAHERQASRLPQARPEEELSWREVQAALDEEIQRLPECYRAPFVLCCLEGQSKAEAARQLGWKEGTVSGRLARARRRLQQRLTRRGVTLSALLATAALTQEASTAAVPAGRSAHTVGAALRFAAGKELPSGPSAAVAAVAQQVGKVTVVSGLKTALVLLLFVGLVGTGVGVLAHQERVAKSAGAQPADGTEPAAVEADWPRPQNDPGRTDRYGDPLPAGALARLGTAQWRQYHSSATLATAFSPDGRTVVTSGDSGLKLWDTSTGKVVWQVPRASNSKVEFAPNGKWLVASGQLLDTASGAVVRHFASGYPLAFSPDSKLLAIGMAQDGLVTLWDTATGQAVHPLRGHEQPVNSGVFTPDGRTLVTMDFGKRICHWDVATGRLRTTVAMPVPGWSTLRLSPDARTLAIINTGALTLWDTATGKERGKLEGDTAGGRYGLAFSPDGRTLAANWHEPGSQQAAIRLWDLASGKLLRRFSIPVRALGALRFAPDNRILLSAGSEPRIRLWDSRTGQPLPEHVGHDNEVVSLAFTPDGQELVSGSSDGTIRVWDPATGRQRRLLPGHRRGVYGLVVTPDGRAVLSGGHDAELHLQNLRTGKELRRLVLVPEDKKPHDGSYAPDIGLAADGRTAVSHIGAAGPGPLVHVWDLTTGQVRAQRTDLSRAQFGAFSPDARLLLSYEDSYGPATPPQGPRAAQMKARGVEMIGTQAVVQEVATGRRLFAFPLPDCNGGRAAFAPDGRTLVTYTYRVSTDAQGSHWDAYTLRLWELATGKERLTIPSAETGRRLDYEAIGFAPDGRSFATARRDHTLQLWDVATGRQLASRSGYEAPVYALAFRPDGKGLATGHMDSTILVWDLAPASPKREGTAQAEPGELAACWDALAGDDARQAHVAIWRLTAVPEQAVPLLDSRLRPAVAVPAATIRQWIAELDGNSYRQREAASARLAELGEEAEPALRDALQGNPSPDLRRRAEHLLARWYIVHAPDKLRGVRAVEVLEHIGTPQARQVLQRLAGGAPEARLTREAKASLGRLVRRDAIRP